MKYNFDEIVERKNTVCEKWDYQGGDYIPMWVADMDFKSPPAILEALHKRVEHGVFGYTENKWCLTDTIISYYKKKCNVDISPEWIVWVSSLMVGVNIACRMAKGNILYNVPMYSHIRKLTKEVHELALEVPLHKEEKDGNLYFTMDFNAMEEQITDQVKSFVLCNPHNPVGRVYTKPELLEVSRFCREHDLVLISDEIHSDLILEGEHIPAFLIDDWARENSITLTSAAKTYNIASLPTAFAIIPNPELRKRYLDAAAGLIPTSNPLTIAAFQAAYTECDDWKEELLSYLRANRDYMEDWAKKMQIPITHLEGTYLSWMDVHKYGEQDLWKLLRKQAGVNYGNGVDFGEPGFLRINLACPKSQLIEALKRTEAVLNTL